MAASSATPSSPGALFCYNQRAPFEGGQPMKTVFIALSAIAIAPFASATDIQITYSAEFQEKLEDDYGIKEGDKLSEDIRGDLEREFGKAKRFPLAPAVSNNAPMLAA